jgi:hypothetical protein
MRSSFVKKLTALDAVAIESPLTGIGIPDVNCIGGWFECKWLRTWPKKCDVNPVVFDHPLSKEQGVWLYRRSRLGGLAMCVCQVAGREWFFFDGYTIKDRFNKMTRPEMRQEAVLYMPNGLETGRLIDYVRSYKGRQP